MNTAPGSVRLRADGSDPGLQGVIAYVSDADTEAVLQRVVTQLGIAGYEARRGDARNAEKDLRVQRSPAILIVDVAEIDNVLDQMQRLSEVCEPRIQVVVIGSRNDVGLYRELMALGASDYLFKPVTAELVENVLARLTRGEARGGDARLGKLVAISGARGGAGASSLAINLGSYLAEKVSRRVVLVDADTRTGALALLLGAQPNPGLGDALETPSRIDDLFLERATVNVSPRLDLLASEQPIGRTSNVAIDAIDTLLGRLRAGYHYVIFDIAQPVRSAFDAVLTEANLHILVTEATLLSARDAARTIERAGQNQRVMLVHNKAGRQGDLGAEDFATGLRRKPDLTIPYNPRVFGAGVNLGKLAWKSDSRIEEAVGRLARELSGRATSAKAPAAGLLQRLIGARK